MNPRLLLLVPDETAMEALGAALACAREGRVYLYLHGELGAGKTTLVRGFLRAAGHPGPVRSPTYTLVEPYDLDTGPGYHLDLYRLSSPEELEYLGVRDLERADAVLLVEWPERGAGALPAADVTVTLEYADAARRADLEGRTDAGKALLARLAPPQGCTILS